VNRLRRLSPSRIPHAWSMRTRKTLLLKAFTQFFGDQAIDISTIEIDPEETLIEGVGKNVKEAIEILSLCGLNDAFLFLRKYRELSDGQKYRYRLAKLVDSKDKGVWILDEFCATLDRVMAKIVAFLVQKVGRRLGKTVVVATTHDDLVEDFQPDVIINKGFEKDIKILRQEFTPKQCSILRHVRVEKGDLVDYEKLSRFHYKTREEGPATNLRLKDCYRLLFNDDLIGVIVYSHSFMNLRPRNMVFGERYVCTPGDQRKAQLINDEIARISRVVIHPKFRGIGLGAYIVRETLPKVNAKVVEVLAVMAKYNPFFEKAGMCSLNYRRKESSTEKALKEFLGPRGFDFSKVRSKIYCKQFFDKLDEADRGTFLSFLREYASQPFIKIERITPYLLTRVFSPDAQYLCWVRGSI
jgi:GNAT superfamily N-acetyltransferase